jgi:phage tail-like protein
MTTSIQDLAFNPFETASSPMIGFSPGAFAPIVSRPAPELSLLIYRFLIEGIREEDQAKGNQFVERFLQGPQEVWRGIDRSIRSLPDMWSITKSEDRFLQFLKWIVGWTSELDYVTNDLDLVTLRRLIAASVPFWKIRGTEDALAEILRLTTGARLRILNWFDLRYIVGETGLGEVHEGHDSWMLSFGAPDYNESRINLRIVDDGTLNRRLVRNLTRLTRPGGERISISYLGLLDQFQSDGDSSQWTESVGTDAPVVVNGEMAIGPTNAVYANSIGADSWRNYMVSVVFRGGALVFEAYRTGDGDAYLFSVDTATGGTIYVYRLLAGTPVPIAVGATYLVPVFNGLGVDSWLNFDSESLYTLRVSLIPEGPATRITAWLNGNRIVEVVDAAHSHGGIGFTGAFTPTTALVSEVELFFLPLQEDLIGLSDAVPEDEELPS